MFTRPLKYAAGLCCVALAIAAAPAASPSAHTDLICHTNNAAECYPRIFQATEDFQVIHDDQDLPPGLHVRMDIYSGKKEARLNIPMEGEENNTDEITDSAVVVVEQPESEEAAQKPAMRDQVPQKPPVYEAAGKIQPPRDGDDDGNIYVHATKALQRHINAVKALQTQPGGKEVTDALSDLSDLAHDIYYGVQISENAAVIKALNEILIISGEEHAPLRHAAASVLSGAVQNNPTAVEGMINSWAASNGNLPLIMIHRMTQEPDIGTIKAMLSFVNGLLRHPDLRNDFLNSDMGPMLLGMLARDTEDWDGVRVKIAQLVSDNFLDEDMGAQTGVWPRDVTRDEKYCAVEAQANQDGCWEYHVGKVGTKNDGWSNDLAKMLKEGRARVWLMHREL